ncbi:hypothetical protein SAMN05661080_01232 [Modestobacter sp. DSM 44400]|nr:hypothetical protein SAMN05661080_01232 [Modestobacter sp. DSM 44400]
MLVGLVALVALAWETEKASPEPVAGRCTLPGSDLTLTTAQAANAATIAAVARSRGLPPRATVIALATAQQESRLRNLDYGDRDSLGLFQQRPSQGWGTEAQVQDPVYAAGKFLDGLVEVPGWETGRLTEVSQRVQRSGFPEAYQQWEMMATQLAAALLSDVPAQLSCSYTPADATGPVDERAAAVADVVRREAGRPTVRPGGVVSVADAGWPEASWAVAHAERLQLTGVRFADWSWSPDGGWTQTGADARGLQLQLAT